MWQRRCSYIVAVKQRRTPGWQLPYLRLSLILRRLRSESYAGAVTTRTRREIANVERVRGEISRAGWFN